MTVNISDMSLICFASLVYLQVSKVHSIPCIGVCKSLKFMTSNRVQLPLVILRLPNLSFLTIRRPLFNIMCFHIRGHVCLSLRVQQMASVNSVMLLGTIPAKRSQSRAFMISFCLLSLHTHLCTGWFTLPGLNRYAQCMFKSIKIIVKLQTPPTCSRVTLPKNW